MGRFNREWHLLHRMPKNPTIEQRMRWHLQHAANCDCRPIPQRLLDEMARRGYPPATARSLK
ncbi:hypothetical protein [Pelagibacterium limicola]|uniref:hypothetical protein n=1 Tax=Pelagibacterium limicola TaxID=2791022 RepID=UPI0018B01676|nr:hypothetical protein [Pelagibacterium limicola]